MKIGNNPKVVIVIVAVLGLMIGGSVFNSIAKAQEDFDIYTNNDYGISVEYPSDWEPSERGLSAYQVVGFYPSDDNILGGIEIFVYSFSHRPNATLEELIAESDPLINTKEISRIDTATVSGLHAVEKVYYQYENDKTARKC